MYMAFTTDRAPFFFTYNITLTMIPAYDWDWLRNNSDYVTT